MNIRELCKIETGLDHIAQARDVPVADIVRELIGLCWNEEEAAELLAHISDETDV